MRFQSLSWVFLWFLLAAAPASLSQNDRLQSSQTLRIGQKPSPEEEQRLRMEREMAKKANQARQADLKRDTEKLVTLATELKEYLDETNESTLSVDVIKKAEEIEKLARSVKDKMKGSN